MLNFKQFLSKPEPVALSIEPYLSFLSIGKEVKVIIDSGEEDMNQKVAQTRLDEKQSANISRIFVRGFDKIYHEFSDGLVPKSLETPDDVLSQPVDVDTSTNRRISKELDVKDKAEPTTESLETQPAGFIKNTLALTQLQDQVFPSDEYHNDRTLDASLIANIKEAFEHEEGIIFGQVCLELGNKEVFVVANPIYTVVPSESEDGLEFVPAETAKAYISEEWHSEFASALVSMTSDTGDVAPARNESRRRAAGGAVPVSKGAKLGLGAAVLVVFAFLTYSFAMPSTSKTASAEPKGMSLNAFMSSATPQATASNADYDPYAISTTGMPSAEQMAQMQTAATHDVLKGMNVDLNSTSDLGCLSQ